MTHLPSYQAPSKGEQSRVYFGVIRPDHARGALAYLLSGHRRSQHSHTSKANIRLSVSCCLQYPASHGFHTHTGKRRIGLASEPQAGCGAASLLTAIRAARDIDAGTLIAAAANTSPTVPLATARRLTGILLSLLGCRLDQGVCGAADYRPAARLVANAPCPPRFRGRPSSLIIGATRRAQHIRAAAHLPPSSASKAHLANFAA
jgi:hypothetical protein